MNLIQDGPQTEKIVAANLCGLYSRIKRLLAWRKELKVNNMPVHSIPFKLNPQLEKVVLASFGAANVCFGFPPTNLLLSKKVV